MSYLSERTRRLANEIEPYIKIAQFSTNMETMVPINSGNIFKSLRLRLISGEITLSLPTTENSEVIAKTVAYQKVVLGAENILNQRHNSRC